MKVSPISFGDYTIQALLDGKKTQVRKIHKGENKDFFPYGNVGDYLWVKEAITTNGRGDWLYTTDLSLINASCPLDWQEEYRRESTPIFKRLFARHMPLWASRFTLEITNVRIEALQDISEDDAKAEGVFEYKERFPKFQYHKFVEKMGCSLGDLKPAFRQFWQSENGGGSWDTNPWVYVITFKVHKKNIKEVLNEQAIKSN